MDIDVVNLLLKHLLMKNRFYILFEWMFSDLRNDLNIRIETSKVIIKHHMGTNSLKSHNI